MQKDENGVEKPIHYISRALRKAETNYSVWRELQLYTAQRSLTLHSWKSH